LPIDLSNRRVRALAAIPLLFLLTAGKTTVSSLPETMIALPPDKPIGQPFVARKGDVILRAKIYDSETATLDAPLSVKIAKFSYQVDAGTMLEPVLAPDKTRERTGVNGRLYCGNPQRTRSETGELLIGSLFSKYSTMVRFCFADTDKDRKLDKVFLAGAKSKSEQGAHPIEPVPFSTKTLQPDDQEGEIQLVVGEFWPKANEVTFHLVVRRKGGGLPTAYILTLEQDGKLKKTYPDIRTDPDTIPYPVTYYDLLGASVDVVSVNAPQGEAELRINKNFGTRLFKAIGIIYETVYIYL
jgi:hypothetical protein